MNETSNVSRTSECPAHNYIRMRPAKKSREDRTEKTEKSREKRSKESEESQTEQREISEFDNTDASGTRDAESAEQAGSIEESTVEEPVETAGSESTREILDSSNIELADYSMRVAIQNRLAANSTSDYASTSDMIFQIIEGQNRNLSDLFTEGSQAADPLLNILA